MTRAGSQADSAQPPKWRELTPWLSSLYVVREFRNQGIGTSLVAACADHAKRLGARRPYLYTSVADFYTRLGWRSLGTDEYEDETVMIMRKDLRASVTT
jgi:GNAT superfamily N-acetyltransferase